MFIIIIIYKLFRKKNLLLSNPLILLRDVNIQGAQTLTNPNSWVQLQPSLLCCLVWFVLVLFLFVCCVEISQTTGVPSQPRALPTP